MGVGGEGECIPRIAVAIEKKSWESSVPVALGTRSWQPTELKAGAIPKTSAPMAVQQPSPHCEPH